MFPFAKPEGAQAKRTAWTAGGDSLLERAPALKEASERVIASIVKSLQAMAGTATTIEGMTKGLAPGQLRDVLAAHRADSVAALIECSSVPCTILVTLDGLLVHAIVELLCGGNGAEPLPEEPRDATPIDQQFAHILVTLASTAIQKEWGPRGFGTVRAAKIEGNIPADICGPRVQDVGLMSISIAAFGLEGTMRLVLPPAAVDRFGQVEAAAPAKTDGADPSWTAQLQRELGRAPVKVDAFLEANDLTLGTIAELQVGQVIALPPDARERAALVCDGRTLYHGELGQLENRYSLRIDDITAETPPSTTPDTGPVPEESFFELS